MQGTQNCQNNLKKNKLWLQNLLWSYINEDNVLLVGQAYRSMENKWTEIFTLMVSSFSTKFQQKFYEDQNHNEKPIRMATDQNKTENNNFWQGYTLLTEIQTGATATEQNGSSSKNLQTQLPLAPVSTDYIPKEPKQGMEQIYTHPMSQQHYSQGKTVKL